MLTRVLCGRPCTYGAFPIDYTVMAHALFMCRIDQPSAVYFLPLFLPRSQLDISHIQSSALFVLIKMILPSSQSRIAELATTISQHTRCVDDYLTENDSLHPSFHVDGPAELRLPSEIEQSRIIALQASQELNDLLQKPKDLLFNHQVWNALSQKEPTADDSEAQLASLPQVDF
jgi:hypothetical protein